MPIVAIQNFFYYKVQLDFLQNLAMMKLLAEPD